MFERAQVNTILSRMTTQKDQVIQVVVGPRQTGKSTMLEQALSHTNLLAHSVSADDILAPSETWLKQEWQQARNLQQASKSRVILVLDEIQKVPQWPTIVKGLWDQDRRNHMDIQVFLSGSSSLLLRYGLEDSLMGRFELIRSPHWSLKECEQAFGTTYEEFLFYGGFPAAEQRRDDEKRWRSYMRDSIIEPTITKDALADEHVRKPALLRALFELGAQYSSQELSYNKIMGQLAEAGNVSTLAHYLSLLDKASMLTGLQKYHPKALVQRKSSPRFLVYDQSLMSATSTRKCEHVLQDPALRGHLVETCIGAHLLALAKEHGFYVTWWREHNKEVDFVIYNSEHVAAIEVKSGRTKSLGGMNAFLTQFPQAMRVVIGDEPDATATPEQFLRNNFSIPGIIDEPGN